MFEKTKIIEKEAGVGPLHRLRTLLRRNVVQRSAPLTRRDGANFKTSEKRNCLQKSEGAESSFQPLKKYFIDFLL